MALLARILSGAPEVYWDIQTSNPFAVEARECLRDGLERLEDALRPGEPEALRALLAELRDVLGPEQEALALLCADLFDLQRESSSAVAGCLLRSPEPIGGGRDSEPSPRDLERPARYRRKPA